MKSKEDLVKMMSIGKGETKILDLIANWNGEYYIGQIEL